MPGLASLASAVGQKLPDQTSSVILIELGANDSAVAASYFQYFPETLSDGKDVNYQQKEIPGGSLPLYQWISSGQRPITFTAIFTSDVDLGTGTDLVSLANSKTLSVRLASAGVSNRNIDIRAAVAWLRRYMLPSYGTQTTQAPSKLRLSIPGSGIGGAGGMAVASALNDSMVCVMTQCEVAHEAFFPSGLPRYTTVNLAFAQIPQLNGQVSFPSRNQQMDALVTTPGAYSQGYLLNAPGWGGTGTSSFPSSS